MTTPADWGTHPEVRRLYVAAERCTVLAAVLRAQRSSRVPMVVVAAVMVGLSVTLYVTIPETWTVAPAIRLWLVGGIALGGVLLLGYGAKLLEAAVAPARLSVRADRYRERVATLSAQPSLESAAESRLGGGLRATHDDHTI